MLKALATLLAVTVLIVAGHPHDRQSVRPWRIHDAPFRVDVVNGGRVVTSFGGSAAPFTYTTADGAEHELIRVTKTTVHGSVTTLTVSAGPGQRPSRIVLRPAPSGLRVSYAAPGGDSVTAVRFALAAPPAAHFLGTGERIRWVDMRRTVVPLKVYNACTSSAPTTLFASTAGFGGWIDSPNVGRIAFPGAVDDSTYACDLGSPPCGVGPATPAVRVCLKATSATFDVRFGSIPQVIRAHARSAGFPRPPWLPQFALIKWRDEVSGEPELLDDLHQLRSRDLPVGWILLDNPWERGARQGCYGSLTFDPTEFPDPTAMIATLHRSGVRFMLWISPQIARGACPAPSLPDGYLTGNDAIFVRDLSNPHEFREFTDDLRRLVSLGVDGFKGDRGDEVNLEPDALVGGPGVVEQNRYTRLYAQAVADAFAAAGRTSYGTLFRTFGYDAGPLLPGAVGPDEPQTWTGLQGAIRAAQTEGLTGAVVWGSDVGGYSGGALSSELFTRWSQFAALTPIFEVGGAGENATFWDFGASTVASFRDAATLHYELVPYLYELAHEATTTALPVVRPLGLTWPGDGRAWARDLEFTVGDALLAAPLVASGATSQVYLPHGRWIDFFTGRRFDGGRTIPRTSTADTFPLYVRAGSALPFNARTPAVWTAPWRTNDLLRADRQGWLVAPAPGTSAEARDRASVLRARTDARGVTTIAVAGALREQQFVVMAPRPICRVDLVGKPLRRASPTMLVGRASGWSTDPTRRAAYLVKTTGASPVRLVLSPCR